MIVEHLTSQDPRSVKLPTFTWWDLQRELLALREGTSAVDCIPHMVRAAAITTQWVPREAVLREVCRVSWAAISDT